MAAFSILGGNMNALAALYAMGKDFSEKMQKFGRRDYEV